MGDDITFDDEGEKPQLPEKLGFKQTSVTEIIEDCNAAAAKMSPKNPHRMVVLNAAGALKQLVNRLYTLEHPEGSVQ